MDAADDALDRTGNASFPLYPPVRIWPYIAYGMAMTGDFRGAHAEIDRTPGDCDLCLRMRGKIDAAEKNYAGGAFWFARGNESGAIHTLCLCRLGPDASRARAMPTAQSRNSSSPIEKGPHFADPLEGWGEALMAQNRPIWRWRNSRKPTKYAPNWGRLHLKWGEALTYAGKRDEAHAQFARAAALDLTPSEKAELAGMTHG